MEKLKDLGFDEYLRNVFSGGITLFAWIVLSPDKVGFLVIKGALSQGFVLFGLSLLIGVLIYSIHRAIIYPFLQLLVFWLVYQKPFWKFNVPKYNIMSWERLNNEKDVIRHIRKWASKFHFLYCTAWGVGGTLILLCILNPDICCFQSTPFKGFLTLALVALGSACVDALRGVNHEKSLLSPFERKSFIEENWSLRSYLNFKKRMNENVVPNPTPATGKSTKSSTNATNRR